MWIFLKVIAQIINQIPMLGKPWVKGKKTHVEIIQLVLVVTPNRVVEIVVLRNKSQCLVGTISYNVD